MTRDRFVSALHIPAVDSSTLLSGGGDPALKLWDWKTGQEKAEIPIAEAIEPFIVIERVLGKNRWSAEEEGDDNGGEGGGKGKGRKSRRNKGKGKGQQEEAAKDNVESMDVDDSPAAQPAEAPAGETSSTSQTSVPQKILAVRRIETLTVQNAATFILFSAIGYEVLSIVS